MRNKTIIMTLIIVFALMFQAGCSNNEKEEELPSNGIVTEEPEEDLLDDENEGNQESKDIMEQFNSLSSEEFKLEEMIDFIDENISLVSEEEASIMIEELEEAHKDYLVVLEEEFSTNENIAKAFNEIYLSELEINNPDHIEDEEVKAFSIEIMDTGYKVEAAEGTYFPVINYEFYNFYASYVTPDIEDYINIMATESNKVPAKDAALVIGWHEVIERTLAQEEFIKKYPNSSKIENIKKMYKNYVGFALLGLDNTPLFDYDDNVMDDDAKDMYMEAVGHNENSEFLDKLEEFMVVLKENNYKLTDDVIQYRKNTLESIL